MKIVNTDINEQVIFHHCIDNGENLGARLKYVKRYEATQLNMHTRPPTYKNTLQFSNFSEKLQSDKVILYDWVCACISSRVAFCPRIR